MTSREKILGAVLKNQPEVTILPDITGFKGIDKNTTESYINVFRSIGGMAFLVDNMESIQALIHEHFDTTKRVVTTIDKLSDRFEMVSNTAAPHTYDDVEMAIISARLAVAENGAVWLTEDLMGQRIIPYICQHLAVIVSAETIVPTLHEAYDKIGTGDYGFGAFIAGPSKTADIEQALVLGAHGPLSMTVFIVK